MAEELHIVSICLVGKGQSLLYRVEFHKTGQHGRILLHCLAHCLNLCDDLAHVLGNFKDAHVETSMLLLVLVEE